MKMKIEKQTYLFIAIVLISIFIRLPHINRPISKHHEFNTAMILNVTNTWSIHDGMLKNYCTPMVNYGNPGDSYLGNHPMVYNNKIYYLSFGSLQFVISYCWLKITRFLDQIIAIRVLGMLLSFVALYLLYILTKKLYPQVRVSPLILAGLFLLNHSILWYFGNAFMHEVLVLIFVLASTCKYLQILDAEKNQNKNLLLYCIVCFLGIVTDWFMLFVIVAQIFYALVVAPSFVKKRVFTSSFFVSLLSMATIFLLYASATDAQFVIESFKYKFLSRVADDKISHGVGLFSLIVNFVLVVNVFFLILFFVKYLFEYDGSKKVLFLLILPAFIYNLVFIRFAAQHEYAFLKVLIPMILLVIVLLSKLKSRLKSIILLTYSIFNIGLFYYFNPIGSVSYNGDKYNYEQAIGKSIKENTSKDEHLFMLSDNVNNAAVIYYAQRNIKFVPDIATFEKIKLEYPDRKVTLLNYKRQ